MADSDASLANFDSVIDGLDVAADIYDFYPEVPHLHRDWAHPSHICSTGLGSPLPEVGAAAGALAGSAGSTVVLEYPLGCVPAVPLNPMQSPQVWKSTESVGWEKMVVPGKVVPFS